ncbi:uncharacterized protein B0H18DRAFT_547026 [Fomitopsis serialis]|uniref:uncharacterized protein n=1 Tax=Fomitopsis serialis TaxID=139415 RepID=UPI0020083FFD|nr:uncharacterized protein B0H18DRAFT_547026 [Neoantrodia serialis]KAH9934194.1 hypothetical protein B0H18DRAFT_547026 [Neoantrodia serialis]
MRFAFALAVFAATLTTTVATNLFLKRQHLPSCAEACIEGANTSGCSASDDECLCSSSAFVDNIKSCVQSSCSASDLANAQEYFEAFCAKVGVSLSASTSATVSSSVSTSSSVTVSISASIPASSDVSNASACTAMSALAGTSAYASSGPSVPSATGSGTLSYPPASTPFSASGATSHAANTFAGLAAIGAVVLALRPPFNRVP